MRKKQHHAEAILALQLGGSVLHLPVQYNAMSVEGHHSILRHQTETHEPNDVITVARDNMPMKCLHRRPSNNFAEKFHGQYNLQQPRRYQTTAW